ncbi:MAG: hypothetical protein IPM52_14485 [Bacteroidetes bacterium]|nr:hypothetical protein [Bacteroidota bacterium]
MMRRTFTLQLKPFSVNAMYGRDRNRKTADCYDWEMQACHLLRQAEPAKALKELREAFDVSKHCYVFRFTFAFHSSIFFTKDGAISSRSFDLTNVEKILADILCGPKYHEAPAPQGAPNLNIDDKLVLQVTSRKIVQQQPGYSIRVAIAIVDKPRPPSA